VCTYKHTGAFVAGSSECRASKGSRSSDILTSQLPVCSKCKAAIELTLTCHMRRRIHACKAAIELTLTCHMRRRIHACKAAIELTFEDLWIKVF
jgi:hypothetical protein